MTDLWNYRTTARTDTATDLTGFQVVANDGSIGKIDQATYEVGTSYVVVDTGPGSSARSECSLPECSTGSITTRSRCSST